MIKLNHTEFDSLIAKYANIHLKLIQTQIIH